MSSIKNRGGEPPQSHNSSPNGAIYTIERTHSHRVCGIGKYLFQLPKVVLLPECLPAGSPSVCLLCSVAHGLWSQRYRVEGVEVLGVEVTLNRDSCDCTSGCDGEGSLGPGRLRTSLTTHPRLRGSYPSPKSLLSSLQALNALCRQSREQ